MIISRQLAKNQIKRVEFLIWNLKLYQKENKDDDVLNQLIEKYQHKLEKLIINYKVYYSDEIV